MINVAPGATFEAVTSAFAHLATVAVRIRTSSGADFLARTTSGVTEDVTVGTAAVFRVALTAPSAEGQYTLVWDNGSIVATEELVVGYQVAIADTGDVYCSLDDVKNALQLQDQSYADADITRAISAASRAIDAVCGRRFYPDADANQARRYRPVNAGYCLIDDLCEFTSLLAQDSDWTLDQDFYFEPTNADSDGQPWTGIRTIARPFLFTLADSPSGWGVFDGRITLTGKFGWLAPPAEVVQASVLYASRLLVRTRQAPLAIVASGLDSPAVRLSRTDPDVAALIDPYTLTFLA